MLVWEKRVVTDPQRPGEAGDAAALALEVVLRTREGHSQARIATALGISRKRVRTILERYHQSREQGMDALGELTGRKRKSKLDEWVHLIKHYLDTYPDITTVRLLEELREAGYEGGITILRERVRLMRAKPAVAPIIRFETEPGKQGQMDWSPYKINFTRTGRQEVQCFSYVLGYSRRRYLDFTHRRDFYTLIRRHVDAYQYFGGVPEHCLYDNERTVVLRWEAGRPVYNPSFLRFQTHYGTRPQACRQGRPETKGKVENNFLSVERNLLNGRTFIDLDDLRRTARWWLAHYADTHRHRTTGRPPIALFEESEKAALIPLPPHRYDTSQVVYRVGNAEGVVVFETNQYSIPFHYAGLLLPLKITESEVAIFTPEIELIANHERLPRGAGRTTVDPAHRDTQKDRYGLAPYRETFLALGEHAAAFLEGLQRHHPRRAGLTARLILGFKDRYHSNDINQALYHAGRYHAYEADAVAYVLRAKAQPRTLEASRKRTDPHARGRHLPTIKQRDLAEYPFLDKGARDD